MLDISGLDVLLSRY